MTKKTYTRIVAGAQSWDADINANYDKAELTPIPIPEVPGAIATLAAANQNDRSLSFANEGGSIGWVLAFSNGTLWQMIPRRIITAVPDLTNTTGGTANGSVVAVSGSGADATINDNFAELTVKLNALLAQMRIAAQLVP